MSKIKKLDRDIGKALGVASIFVQERIKEWRNFLDESGSPSLFVDFVM